MEDGFAHLDLRGFAAFRAKRLCLSGVLINCRGCASEA
jgi:hypothetical protein